MGGEWLVLWVVGNVCRLMGGVWCLVGGVLGMVVLCVGWLFVGGGVCVWW